MKTIKTQEIDGYKIITNLYDAGGLIDPEATKKIVFKELEKEAVWKDIDKLKTQMGTYAYQSLQAKRNMKSAKTKMEQKKFYDEFIKWQNEMKNLETDLKPLAIQLKEKFKEFMLEHAVYFNVKPDEEIISDEEGDEIRQAMIEATTEGKLLDRNLEKLVDLRGREYWKKTTKWARTVIIRVGEKPPTGAIETKDLTVEQKQEIADQLEAERIVGLTAVEKTAELANALQVLVGKAAMMRSELEIQGNPDAFQIAQDWYEAEKIILENKYK